MFQVKPQEHKELCGGREGQTLCIMQSTFQIKPQEHKELCGGREGQTLRIMYLRDAKLSVATHVKPL
jgi:hypothetical protein